MLNNIPNQQALAKAYELHLPVRYYGINQHFGENRFIVSDGKGGQISFYKKLGFDGHGGKIGRASCRERV